ICNMNLVIHAKQFFHVIAYVSLFTIVKVVFFLSAKTDRRSVTLLFTTTFCRICYDSSPGNATDHPAASRFTCFAVFVRLVPGTRRPAHTQRAADPAAAAPCGLHLRGGSVMDAYRRRVPHAMRILLYGAAPGIVSLVLAAYLIWPPVI